MDMSKRMNNFAKSLSTEDPIDAMTAEFNKIPGMITLTIGEPNFNTPEHIKKAAIKAIEDNHSHYPDVQGVPALRKATADFMHDKYGLSYDPKTQVLVTLGVTEAIHAVFASIINPGDDVIIPTPAYPFYKPNAQAVGAHVVEIDTSKDNFILTPQRLEATLKQYPHAKALVLNYPNNPVGNVYSKDQLTGLAKVIKKYGIFCVCDEIYSELSYDSKHVSMGNIIPDQAIVMNGASKSFAMTGWRIGLVFGPAPVIRQMNALNSFFTNGITTCAQYAAAEGFKNGRDDGLKMRDVYKKRRDILRAGLDKAGFTSPEPGGAFYIFAKIPSQFNQNSLQFAKQLAKEARVGAMPGSTFGPGGEGHLRFSYATSTDNIRTAVKRIQKFVKYHQK